MSLSTESRVAGDPCSHYTRLAPRERGREPTLLSACVLRMQVQAAEACSFSSLGVCWLFCCTGGCLRASGCSCPPGVGKHEVDAIVDRSR